jgi:hypothetical protein
MRRIALGSGLGAVTVVVGGALALAAQVGQTARLTPTSSPHLSAVQQAAAGALEAQAGVPGISPGSATAATARPPQGTRLVGEPDVRRWQALRGRYFVPGSSADRAEAQLILVTVEAPATGGLSSLRLTTRYAAFGHAVVVAHLARWADAEGSIPTGTSTATMTLIERHGAWQVSTMTFSDFSPV